MKKKNISSSLVIFLVIAFFLSGVPVSGQEPVSMQSSSEVDYSAKALNPLQLTIEQKHPDSLKFRVVVYNPENRKLFVEVIDRMNGVVNTQVNSGSVVAINYDFNNAPDGEYLVRVKSGKLKVTDKIIIETIVSEKRVAVFKRPEVQSLKPF